MTATQTNQNAAVAFLKTHATSGASVADDVIQTHGALVFLHETEALKIKRAVKYDYMDFSTLALRKEMLRRELDLNANAAPGLYRDVVALTQADDGTLALDGDGQVVEWVLRMTRFPAEAELSALAARGLIDTALARDLGQSIAQYHLNAPSKPESGRVLIQEIIDELARVMADMQAHLGCALVDRFLTA